jgi:hypothetical protein
MRELQLILICFIIFNNTIQSQNIITYWHFNDLPSGTLNDPIEADFTVLSEGSFIEYRGESEGYMDRVNEGTGLNVAFNNPPGYALRVRNPSDTRQLIIQAPTIGFKEIKASYAVTRTNNGQTVNEVEYTLDGSIWLSSELTYAITADFELIQLDFSDIAGVDDNPDFAFRIIFTENSEGSNGNNRYDNIQITGNPIPASVSSVKISPSIAEIGINQQVQFNADVFPANATNKNVTWHTLDDSIAIINQEGILTGLQPGNTSIVVTTEDGEFTDTALVNVLMAYPVIFLVNDASGPIENAKLYLSSDTLITDQAGLITTSLIPGTYNFTVELVGFIPFIDSFTVQNESVLVEVQLRPIPVTLAYYWHFNDLIPDNIVNFAFADYPGNNKGILYYGGFGNGYMDDFEDGSPLNLHLSQPAGSALRVRNPSVDRALIIEMPMTMYKDPVLIYDVQRSNNGMLSHTVEYTLDGINWRTNGLRNNVIRPNTFYNTWLIDFTGLDEIENNDHFAVRMTFEGNTDQDNGNQRFDNIALFANESQVSTNNIPIISALSIHPNPVQNHLFFNHLNKVGHASICIINSSGSIVKYIKLNTGDAGRDIMIEIENLQPGLYHVVIEDGKIVKTGKFIKSN